LFVDHRNKINVKVTINKAFMKLRSILEA